PAVGGDGARSRFRSFRRDVYKARKGRCLPRAGVERIPDIRRRNMKILIADDDDVSRLALEAMLTKRGYEVALAADGIEAWEAFQGEDAPQMAILDWMMPGLDGVELCRRIREDPRLKAVYLILLTSRESKEHLLEGLRAGANDYVTKPF